MRSIIRFGLATTAAALTLLTAACDQARSPLAPKAHAPTASPLWVHAGGDTLVDTFTLPAGTTASFTEDFGDGSVVEFPRGLASVCDAQSTRYGPGTWDQPCTVATQPITFTVKMWKEANGMPHIDFSPSVRFAPEVNVSLAFHSPTAANAWWSNIQYCATATSACIDESLTDPSLTTDTDPATGYIFRRIKHFSGYNVVAD